MQSIIKGIYILLNMTFPGKHILKFFMCLFNHYYIDNINNDLH